MQHNTFAQQVQEKISKLTPNDVTYFLKKKLDDLVSSNDHYNTKIILDLISLPDYAQFSKGLQMEKAFDLLLNNIQIKQVAKICQQFLENKINPSDRILSKVIEYLSKEAELTEIEDLFKNIQKCNSNINLVEVFNPLFILNNIVLIRKILVTMSLEHFGINQVWASIIEVHFQKSFQIDELRAALKEFTSQNLQKIDIMENLYNINVFLSFLIILMKQPKYAYHYNAGYDFFLDIIQRTNTNEIINILNRVKCSFQGNFKINYQIEILFNTFQLLIVFIVIIQFDRSLQKYISNNQKFELFCLIELLLSEQGFNFQFEDLMLSQNDLKYIVKQQSFFNKFLNKVEKSRNSSNQIIFQNDEQLFQEKQDYLLECISFASEVSDISEI